MRAFFQNIASRLHESPLFHFWRVLGPLKSNVKITKISKNHKWDYDLCFCVSCTREANFFKKSRGAYTRIIFLFKADVPKVHTYLPPWPQKLACGTNLFGALGRERKEKRGEKREKRREKWEDKREQRGEKRREKTRRPQPPLPNIYIYIYIYKLPINRTLRLHIVNTEARCPKDNVHWQSISSGTYALYLQAL